MSENIYNVVIIVALAPSVVATQHQIEQSHVSCMNSFFFVERDETLNNKLKIENF